MEPTKQALKEYVKEQYGKELSDEETEELFEKLRTDGALTEEELERVSAAGIDWGDVMKFIWKKVGIGK